MKKPILIIAILLLCIFCTKEVIEEDCGCIKTTYLRYKEYVTISEEEVDCQENIYDVKIVDNVYYKVVCESNKE